MQGSTSQDQGDPTLCSQGVSLLQGGAGCESQGLGKGKGQLEKAPQREGPSTGPERKIMIYREGKAEKGGVAESNSKSTEAREPGA